MSNNVVQFNRRPVSLESHKRLRQQREGTLTTVDRKSVRPAEAAELLSLSRDTVYVLMRAGRLRSVKIGRARLIPLAAIEEFLSATEEYAV